jgi:hypothetical protein
MEYVVTFICIYIQLHTVLCYNYTDDMIFEVQLLK